MLYIVYLINIVSQAIIHYKECMELIAIRVPEDIKKKLEKMATEQHRPLSNLIRLILMQWLEKEESKTAKVTD